MWWPSPFKEQALVLAFLEADTLYLQNTYISEQGEKRRWTAARDVNKCFGIYLVN